MDSKPRPQQHQRIRIDAAAIRSAQARKMELLARHRQQTQHPAEQYQLHQQSDTQYSQPQPQRAPQIPPQPQLRQQNVAPEISSAPPSIPSTTRTVAFNNIAQQQVQRRLEQVRRENRSAAQTGTAPAMPKSSRPTLPPAVTNDTLVRSTTQKNKEKYSIPHSVNASAVNPRMAEMRGKLRQSILIDPSTVFTRMPAALDSRSGTAKQESTPQAMKTQSSAEKQEYLPVSADYRVALARALRNLAENENSVDDPSAKDFLSEEGYYGWLDYCEQSGRSKRFEPLIAEMLECWNIQRPLLQSASATGNTSKQPLQRLQPGLYETTVNFMVRVIEAKDLPLDGKQRERCWFASIEYPRADGTESRFQTKVSEPTSQPVWNQQVALTVNNLHDPIVISLYYAKEKTGLFTDDIKEGFMGAVELNVQQLITQTVKSGFLDQWYALGDCSGRRPAQKGKLISGEVLIEVEMGGIVNDGLATTQSTDILQQQQSSGQDDSDWQLQKLQHRLIMHKVNLKSVYSCLVHAAVLVDLCVSRSDNILHLRLSRVPWSLSADAWSALNEFARIWSISEVYKRMKLMEMVFLEYQQQRCHARALLSCYRDLYEGIWKSESIWLPEYEKPLLHQLMTNIEVYLTRQIKSFKEFFPPPSPASLVTGKQQQMYCEQIHASIDCVLCLTRMIDKNPFFLAEMTAETEAGISELDYKNGKFSFGEKLRALLHNRAFESYQMMAEAALPAEHSSESLSALVEKCLHLANAMLAEVEEYQMVYQPGFRQETDLVAVFIEVYTKYFMLEMENMAAALRSLPGASGSGVGNSSSPQLLPLQQWRRRPSHLHLSSSTVQLDDKTIDCAMEMMKVVYAMQQRWNQSLAMRIDEQSWFAPFINQWLDRLCRHSQEWVRNACALDQWKLTAVSGDDQRNHRLRPSSSTSDIFSALHQSLDLFHAVLGNWPRNSTYAQLMTMFAEIVYDTISSYCMLLEQMAGELTAAQLASLSPQTNIASAGKRAVIEWFAKVSASATSLKTANNIGNNIGNNNNNNPLDEECNISAQTLLQPAADGKQQECKSVDDVFRRICCFLTNLEDLSDRLEPLYRELDGPKVQSITNRWRAEKLQRNNNNAALSITGLLKVKVLSASDLRPLSGYKLLSAQKLLPYVRVFICDTADNNINSNNNNNTNYINSNSNGGNGKSGQDDISSMVPVCITEIATPATLNPLFSRPDINRLTHQHNNNNSSSLIPIPIRQGSTLRCEIWHRNGSDSDHGNNDTLIGTAKLELNEGTLNQLADNSTTNRLVWSLPVDTQGQLCLQLVFVNPAVRNHALPSLKTPFGRFGMEDIEYILLERTKRTIYQCRDRLANRIVQLISAGLSPLLDQMFQSIRQQPNQPLAEHQLLAVSDFLNHSLSTLATGLSDSMAQLVIHRIWQHCIQMKWIHYRVLPSSMLDKQCAFSHAASGLTMSSECHASMRKLHSMLVDFFHADGEGIGLPIDLLQSTDGICPGCCL